MELLVDEKEPVIVAAVHEPLDSLQFLYGLFIRSIDEVECGMLADGLAHDGKFVIGIRSPTDSVGLVVEPGAHSIAGREQLRMSLTVDYAAAPAH